MPRISEHRAQEPDAVLERQVLAARSAGTLGPRASSRFASPSGASHLSSSGASGIRRRALGRAARAGSPRRVCRVGRRLPSEGWRTRSGSSALARAAALADARRLAVAGVLRAHGARRRPARAAAAVRGRAARASSAACCSPASRTCSLVAVVAPLAGAAAAPPPARPAAARSPTDYAGTALLLRARRGHARRPGSRTGRRSRPSSDDRAAVHGAVARLRARARAGVRAPGSARVDALRLERRRLPRLRAGRATRAAALCLFVDTDQRPPACARDDSMEPNSAFRTVGGFR